MKLIHCADLHLDSPMETHMTAEQASKRNTEIIRSFQRLTEYAKQNKVQAVLIAGDLFDGERIQHRTVEQILDDMQNTPDTHFFYLPGNHDNTAQCFSDMLLPQNLHLFGKEWATYRLGDVVVSGIEMTAFNADSLYSSVPHVDGCLNIVMLHGQVGSESGADKVNLRLLQNKGIDYLALGHIHSYTLQRLDANGMFCYCGCLEGRGFDECGEKGFVLLEAEQKIQAKFIPFACRQLHRIEVDITGLDKLPEIAAKLRLAAQNISHEDMVEFLLTGSSDPTVPLPLSYLHNLICRDFFFAKIKDQTHIALNPEDYQNDISLKGEFIRLVMNSEKYNMEEKAAILRIGLAAVSREEIAL